VKHYQLRLQPGRALPVTATTCAGRSGEKTWLASYWMTAAIPLTMKLVRFYASGCNNDS